MRIKKTCLQIFSKTKSKMLSLGDQATEEEEEERICSQSTVESHSSKGMGLDESELDSEAELMRSMGLPLQFGGVSAQKHFEVNLNIRLLLLFLSLGFHNISQAILIPRKGYISKCTKIANCDSSMYLPPLGNKNGKSLVRTKSPGVFYFVFLFC